MEDIFNEALIFAAKAHAGQTRKANSLPAILHPMEVAVLIANMTEERDVMVAGLLHDTLEDTDATEEELEKEFGPRVLELVKAETEKRPEGLTMENSWKVRKQTSLEELAACNDRDVKIMWLADKLSNMRGFVKLYRVRKDAAFNLFHEKRKSEQEWLYRSIEHLLEDELSDTDAFKEYSMILDEIFGKEKR